ncbi:hypothetical protein [Kitasatospora sp. NPDC088351]|uniref:hypothetical protein n=1 Tax=Kitasatospora sp. NPDC088351 TaxID=3155180 RepID=UPI003445E192
MDTQHDIQVGLAGPGRPMPAADLTAARRRLGEAAREHGSLLGVGLVIWCNTLAGPESVDAVTADLTLLEVPHQEVRVARRPWRPGLGPRPGAEVRIPQGWPLAPLKRQMPSLLRSAARCAPVNFEFDLAAWDLDEDGAAAGRGGAGPGGGLAALAGLAGD